MEKAVLEDASARAVDSSSNGAPIEKQPLSTETDDKRTEQQLQQSSEDTPSEQYVPTSGTTTPDLLQKLEGNHSSRPETSISSARELPQLPYSLRDHKTSIAILWTLLVIDSAILPLVLFFSLWYATNLDPSYIFIITTSVFGLVSGVEWVYRSWKLLKDEEVRPFGGKRYHFDFFHIMYTLGYGISLLELIIGSSRDEPLIRLCSMASPSFIVYTGAVILLFSILPSLNLPAPFKISSVPKGAPMRPACYMIIEDVIAVDTGTGRRYRKAINERYEASPMFRRMLWDLDLFWAIPALLVGAACTVVVLDESVPQNVAYGVAWAVPSLWAGIWALITIKRVQVALAKEKSAWANVHGQESQV